MIILEMSGVELSNGLIPCVLLKKYQESYGHLVFQVIANKKLANNQIRLKVLLIIFVQCVFKCYSCFWKDFLDKMSAYALDFCYGEKYCLSTCVGCV